jgi:hypothetical protein
MAFDYNAHAGAGTENIDKSVLGMPLIGIIQKGSPQFDETHKNHTQKRIEGCKPGDLFFAPTNRVLTRPLEVVVTGTTTLYTEWRPKSQGGGYVGSRPLTVTMERGYRRGVVGTKEEHKEYIGDSELIYTIYMAVRFKLSPDKWENGIISFTSTQLKKGRAWLKQLTTMLIPGTDAPAPLFAGLWSITTGPEKNDEGGWFGYEIKLTRILDGNKDEALLTDSLGAFKEMQSKLPSPKAAAAIAEQAMGEQVADGDGPY